MACSAAFWTRSSMGCELGSFSLPQAKPEPREALSDAGSTRCICRGAPSAFTGSSSLPMK